MASQFAPEHLCVLDYGNAPDVYIDRLGGWSIKNGVYCFTFLVFKSPADETAEENKLQAEVACRVRCSEATLIDNMRRMLHLRRNLAPELLRMAS